MANHGVPPPTPLSLFVCERVIVDAMTGQHSLMSSLPHIQASAFPVAVPSIFVYAEFTNGRGATLLTVRVIDVNEEREPVFGATVQVQMEDPLAVSNLTIGLQNVVFPEAGEYRVQVLAGPVLLIERRLVVVPMDLPPAAEGAP
jgi:hypothetical protein